jgi:uncharacterized damage-inducible protein DinB
MNRNDIRRLFDYTEWANELAMAAADQLSDEHLRRDFGISHQSIFGTLTHTAGAEWVWLERWNGRSPSKAEAWPMWTPAACADIATLKGRWSDIVDRRAQILTNIDEDRLAAGLPFKLLSGDPSSMPLIDQMQHVVNHSTMHRGQIVGMIRQLGIEPPSTDLIFFLRREISPK